MRQRTLKLMAAGVLVAGAWGVVAWATPGEGITGATITGPVLLDEIDVKSESDSHEVEIKVKGLSDAYVVTRLIKPGGHTGWHSHPGPVFVLITAGEGTTYDDTFARAVYPAGTGFVEDPEHAHILVNEGDEDLELVAFILVPAGVAPRIDEREPQP